MHSINSSKGCVQSSTFYLDMQAGPDVSMDLKDLTIHEGEVVATAGDGNNNDASATNGTTIFVTGGGGFVGSHCVMELLSQGFNVIAVDNYANSIKGEATNPSNCIIFHWSQC